MKFRPIVKGYIINDTSEEEKLITMDLLIMMQW